jgi:hypothetical protein
MWHLSAPPGRVIFEIGGESLREEIARDGRFLIFSRSGDVDFHVVFSHLVLFYLSTEDSVCGIASSY